MIRRKGKFGKSDSWEKKGTWLRSNVMGVVGHLILYGLVWKSNRLRKSKRPWDVEANGQTMYYKCISLVNKKCTLMFYPSDSLTAMCVFNTVSEQAYSCPA